MSASRYLHFSLMPLMCGLALAHPPPVPNDSRSVSEGASLFRENCSPCHGPSGVGGNRGPNLNSNHWTHGSSDAAIVRTITQGMPGTEMPANDLEDAEVRSIVAYLRSLTSQKVAVAGKPASGELLFSQQGCSTCHMVKGRGGALGPELSRVGASRSTNYLVDSIRDPNKALSASVLDPNDHYGLPLVYDTVTVVMRSGERIVGVAKNEDTFSIQLIDRQQNVRLIAKRDASHVVHESKSLMPQYTNAMLSESEMWDLIAYLTTLR